MGLLREGVNTDYNDLNFVTDKELLSITRSYDARMLAGAAAVASEIDLTADASPAEVIEALSPVQE